MAVVSLNNAEHYQWGDQYDGWHFCKDPALSVIRECVPAGGTEVRHVHRQAQQFFMILAGRAVIEMNGTDHALAAGEGLHVPAGTPHRFFNPGQDAVQFLVISTPTTRGDRIDLDA